MNKVTWCLPYNEDAGTYQPTEEELQWLRESTCPACGGFHQLSACDWHPEWEEFREQYSAYDWDELSSSRMEDYL
jgi:hypothetical protein